MRPLFTYYGGKQRLASRLVDLLPPHTVYCEPFAGGAALLFKKGRPRVSNTDNYREVLNDLDERLITVYRCLQQPDTQEALLQWLRNTPYSRSEHRRAKAILMDPAAHDTVTRAWAMIVASQQSFGTTLCAGWRTAIRSQDSATRWASYREALMAIINRLQMVTLECGDALAVIRRWDSPQNPLLSTIPVGWEHYELRAYCSADGTGMTGVGRDKGHAAAKDELGNRQRIEVVLRCDRSASVQTDLVPHLWPKRTEDLFAKGLNAEEEDRLL